MKKAPKFRGLILPSDHPPRETSLKRQILFFDIIAIAHPQDIAVLNADEISETFPNKMTVTWSARGQFPRAPGYNDELRRILAQTSALQKDGTIRLLAARTPPSVDARTHYAAFMTALSNPGLVRAALARDGEADEVDFPSTAIIGAEMAPAGFRSRFHVDAAPAYVDPMGGEEESTMAWLRLGRTVKYINLSRIDGAFPIALDSINDRICHALAEVPPLNPGVGESPAFEPDQLAQRAISLDVVDPESLDDALTGMSWAEVQRLGVKIRPKCHELRRLILRRTRIQSIGSQRDQASYTKALAEIRESFEKEQDALADEWRKVGISLTTKTIGGLAGVTGLQYLPFLHGHVATLLLGLVAAGASTISPEMKSLLAARFKAHGSPIFFFDSLATSIRRDRIWKHRLQGAQ